MDPIQAQLQHNSGQAGAHKFQQLTFHPVEHTRMSPTLKHRGSGTYTSYTSFFPLFIFAPSISPFLLLFAYNSIFTLLFLKLCSQFLFPVIIYLSVLTHIFFVIGQSFSFRFFPFPFHYYFSILHFSFWLSAKIL